MRVSVCIVRRLEVQDGFRWFSFACCQPYLECFLVLSNDDMNRIQYTSPRAGATFNANSLPESGKVEGGRGTRCVFIDQGAPGLQMLPLHYCMKNTILQNRETFLTID